MIRIVEATAKERNRVFDLVERLLAELEERPEEFQGIDRAKTLKDLESAGDRFTALLALDAAGRVIGVATVMESFAIYAGGNYGVIDEMYVDPAHRSGGVGKLLIDAVKELGRRRGWLRIDVTAPPEDRWKRTVKFYEKQGFVFTGPKLRFRLP
jgi:GNAT superfamily N-acetyltransferase